MGRASIRLEVRIIPSVVLCIYQLLSVVLLLLLLLRLLLLRLLGWRRTLARYPEVAPLLLEPIDYIVLVRVFFR